MIHLAKKTTKENCLHQLESVQDRKVRVRYEFYLREN